jgi:hypothetical protein
MIATINVNTVESVVRSFHVETVHNGAVQVRDGRAVSSD